MRSMQWQLGILGSISAFAYRHRETKKNLCRGGRSQDLPNTDLEPAVRHLKQKQQYTHSTANTHKMTTLHTRQLTTIHTRQLTTIHTEQLTTIHTRQLTTIHTRQLTTIHTRQLTTIHTKQLTTIHSRQLTTIHTRQIAGVFNGEASLLLSLEICCYSRSQIVKLYQTVWLMTNLMHNYFI